MHHRGIFTPRTELPFAGHPLVGTVWLLKQEGPAPSVLRPPAGEVSIRIVEGPPDGFDLVGVWALKDEDAGLLRARVFAPRVGVEEDEATGAHAVRLAAYLGRRVTIRQGKGSLIFAEPRPDGTVEIWGHTELVEVRKYTSLSNP